MSTRILGFPALILAVSILLNTGCKKDPEIPAPPTEIIPTDTMGTTTVKLTIKPVWNGVPLDTADIHLTPTGQRVRIDLVKFYLSNLALISNGTAQPLFDVDLFDVTSGPLTRVYNAAVGDVDSLYFGLGLSPDLNHTDISTVPVNAPLGNNSGMYWAWATMYRFVLFDGKFDNDTDATGPPPFNFSIHTGLDTCYRTKEIPIALNIDSSDTARITLVVDVAKFFSDGTQSLDLSQNAIWHGEVDMIDVGLLVADLQIAAFSLE